MGVPELDGMVFVKTDVEKKNNQFEVVAVNESNTTASSKKLTSDLESLSIAYEIMEHLEEATEAVEKQNKKELVIQIVNVVKCLRNLANAGGLSRYVVSMLSDLAKKIKMA